MLFPRLKLEPRRKLLDDRRRYDQTRKHVTRSWSDNLMDVGGVLAVRTYVAVRFDNEKKSSRARA